MDFIELAEKRFSVRQFKSDPIEPEKLELIVRSALLAPTACNYQPQRVLMIQGEEAIEKLRKLTPCHYGAAAAALLCYDRDACFKRQDGAHSGEIDASIVGTHMILEAADLGVGSCWVMFYDPDQMREAYHIPENYVPVSLLVFGYAADDAVPNPFHTACLPEEKLIFRDDFAN